MLGQPGVCVVEGWGAVCVCGGGGRRSMLGQPGVCVWRGGGQCVCVVVEGGGPCWDNQVCACGGVGVGKESQDK